MKKRGKKVLLGGLLVIAIGFACVVVVVYRFVTARPDFSVTTVACNTDADCVGVVDCRGKAKNVWYCDSNGKPTCLGDLGQPKTCRCMFGCL